MKNKKILICILSSFVLLASCNQTLSQNGSNDNRTSETSEGSGSSTTSEDSGKTTDCEHIFYEEWKNDENNHFHVCKKCGFKKDEMSHSFQEMKAVNGGIEIECEICKYEKGIDDYSLQTTSEIFCI